MAATGEPASAWSWEPRLLPAPPAPAHASRSPAPQSPARYMQLPGRRRLLAAMLAMRLSPACAAAVQRGRAGCGRQHTKGGRQAAGGGCCLQAPFGIGRRAVACDGSCHGGTRHRRRWERARAPGAVEQALGEPAPPRCPRPLNRHAPPGRQIERQLRWVQLGEAAEPHRVLAPLPRERPSLESFSSGAATGHSALAPPPAGLPARVGCANTKERAPRHDGIGSRTQDARTAVSVPPFHRRGDAAPAATAAPPHKSILLNSRPSTPHTNVAGEQQGFAVPDEYSNTMC